MDDPYWLKFERGQYLILKVDGSNYLVDAKPTFAAIRNSIGADHIDTVTLTWSSGDVPDLVMMFDNTGLIDKPLNEGAAAIARTDIYGNAAIVHNVDLAE
jgi:hypothetical protein